MLITSMQVYKGQQPTEEQISELDELDNRPIDYSDIPATTLKEAGMARNYWRNKLQGEKILA